MSRVDSAQIGDEEGAYAYISLSRVPARDLSALTPTQKRVATLIWEGLSNADIASREGSSVNTVANHVRGVFQRMNVSSRSELIELLSRSQ